MKPIIKKQLYYNVLFLRDDTDVRSFRVKGSTLRWLGYFIVFFVLMAMLGWFASFRYMTRFYDMQAEYVEQGKALVQANMQLEQLTNVKTLVDTSTPRVMTASNTELGLENTVTPNGMLSVNATARSINATVATSSAPVAVNATVAQGSSNATLAAPTAPLYPSIEDPSCPLGIADFTAQKISSQKLRVRFELINKESEQMIGGTTQYIVHYTDGTFAEIAPQAVTEAAFSISRMKRMNSVITIDKEKNINTINKIDIIVHTEQGDIFQGSYPYPRTS